VNRERVQLIPQLKLSLESLILSLEDTRASRDHWKGAWDVCDFRLLETETERNKLRRELSETYDIVDIVKAIGGGVIGGAMVTALTLLLLK